MLSYQLRRKCSLIPAESLSDSLNISFTCSIQTVEDVRILRDIELYFSMTVDEMPAGVADLV
jgi:hypothetical protein